MSQTNGMSPKSLAHGTELRLDTFIQGLQTAMAAGLTSIDVNGVSVPVADLLKKAQELNKPYKDSRAARAMLRATTQDRPKTKQAAQEFLADMKAAMVNKYGRASQDLLSYGFSPEKKRAPMTSEEKVLAAAKRKLTREKRHTMGSRQKSELRETGTPTVTVNGDGAHVSSYDEPAGPAQPGSAAKPV